MNKQIRALLERKSKLVEQARALDAKAEAEARDLTAEEVSESEQIVAQLDNVNAAIKREERLAEEERSIGAVEPLDPSANSPARPNLLDDPKRGFKSFGEFCSAVAGVTRDHQADERLIIGAAAPSTYANEGTGADGGFLVPSDFSREIFNTSLEGESILPLTDNSNVMGNSMVFPADETTPWGTDGIRAYWEGEADAATATKPSFKNRTLRLKKLMALVPVTDELLADAGAISGYLTRKTGESIRWKTNDAIINGDGVGKPTGIFNANALVSVAKETSQTADTIVAGNVAKMYARMPASSLGRAVWLVNQDALPQLLTMTLGDQPIYMPPNSGFQNSPGGFLLGRPVIITQHCKTVGDKGDIYFVDFGAYRTITKAGGVETATSMHLYFDAGATAFRATFRVDGEPSVQSAFSPANGSNNLSPYVTLNARA